jgi:hypothetical protein
MRGLATTTIRLTIVAVVGLTAACRADDPAHARRNADSAKAPIETPENTVITITEEERAAAEAKLQAQADSVDKKLRKIPNLSRQEKTSLQKDVNAVQIARAQQLGIQPGSSVESLTQAGRLVKLADTTDYWIIRKLTYSEPYVTPSAEAMLIEIGKRFHKRLDGLGIPRYRLDVTSILRTPEKQSALRKTNRNASRVVSAHEFGTTLDIAYRRYAPPVQDSIGNIPLDAAARLVADSVMVDVGRQRAAELQAVLGRVMTEMQREGLLMVRMERSQTVYHITVAKKIPRAAQSGRA